MHQWQSSERHPRSLIALSYHLPKWCLILALLGILNSCTAPDMDNASWQSTAGPQAWFVPALAQDPANPRKLYAGALNGGLLYSEDGGNTWQVLQDQEKLALPKSSSIGMGEPDHARDVSSIHVVRDGQIFVGTLGKGVYTHSSNGEWFSLQRSLGGAQAARQVFAGSQDDAWLYAGTQDGLYRIPSVATPDQKWERIDGWTGASLSKRVQTLYANQDITPTLYVGTDGGFFASSDGGETWRWAMQGIDQDARIVSMAVNPQAVDHIVVSSWEKEIYVSTDAGEHWLRSAQVFDTVIEDIVFSRQKSDLVYAITYSGNLYTSTDGGQKWQLSEQIGKSIISLLETSDGRLVAGTDGQGIWVRDAPGAWHQALINGSIQLTVLSMLSTEQGLYVGTECCGIFHRTAQGEWDNLNSGLPLQARSILDIEFDPETKTLYAGTYGDGVYVRSADASRWLPLQKGLARDAYQIQDLKLVPIAYQQVLFAGTYNGLYRLGSGSWTRIESQKLVEIVTNLQWEPTTKTMFATASGGKLYLSRDNGSSWAQDQNAPDAIARLALSTASSMQALIAGTPKWTLIAQTRGGEIHHSTLKNKDEWQKIEIKSNPDEHILLWNYPRQTNGFFLSRTIRSDDYLKKRIPPPVTVEYAVLPGHWKQMAETISVGISCIVPDSKNPNIVYMCTANEGLYQTQITQPGLWTQIPANSPIKTSIPIMVAAVMFALFAYVLIWVIFLKPPQPVELEIHIGSATAQNLYPIRVTGPRETSGETSARLPRPAADYSALASCLLTNAPASLPMTDLGTELFDFIFGDPKTLDLYLSVKKLAKRPKIRLRLDLPAELVSLPWEMLYDANETSFLSLNSRYTVTRRVQSSVELPAWGLAQRLNVLLVTASPRDRPIPLIEQEVAVLEQVAGLSSQVKIYPFEQATPAQVIEQLHKNEYDIFHFVGHAEPGALVLVDDRGQSTRFEFAELEAALTESHLLMAFLNACETAASSLEEQIPSTAFAFFNRGVPLVLAMQHSVSNYDALAFVRSFYTNLLSSGCVDDALYEARQAIVQTHETLYPPSWAIPVLMIRGHSSKLMRALPRWRSWFLMPHKQSVQQ